MGNSKKLLFNFLTLATFGFALFLIIFVKRGEGKKREQDGPRSTFEPSRVKKSAHMNHSPEGLNSRQILLIEEISRRGRMTPKEVSSLIEGVSTRTLRRDMDALVNLKLVSQEGTTKSTIYKYIGN